MSAEAGVAGGKASFSAPPIVPNPSGWGPCTLPEKFTNIPYQPFSKADRLGRAADFTNSAYFGRNRDRYSSQYGAGGDMFAYYHDDESAFQLVDTSKAPKPFFRGTRRWQNRRNNRRSDTPRGMQQLSKSKNLVRDRQKLEKKLRQRWQGRRRWDKKTEKRNLDPSVEVQPSWELLTDISFSRLSKLSMDVGQAEDLSVCGEVEFYDKSYDRVSTKNPKKVVSMDRVFHKVTTTDDPVLRDYAEKGTGNVFATSAVLSALMTCQRARYSWDIVVRKTGGKLFFDKRDDSEFDYLTVNESGYDLPPDDGPEINTPGSLSVEATYLNSAFSQQCLRRDQKHKFDQPNPFAEEDEVENLASVAYRYRKWDLGEGFTLVARTQHDGAVRARDGSVSFINCETLNEWDHKLAGCMDWRRSLDSQQSAVLATELRNNAARVARFTVASLLSGSAYLRLGFLMRANSSDNTNHLIVGTSQYKPQDFAARTINLNMKNCWAILRSLIGLFDGQPDDSKFVILKDPNKDSLKVYKVPLSTFEEVEETEYEGELDLGDIA